jgi:hypothetical protein
MKFLRWVLTVPFVTTMALGQTATQRTATSSPQQPEALVRSLYTQVVAHAPSGILDRPNEKRIFIPYLSKSLRHRIEFARACSRDWARQHQGQVIKAPFGWAEAGPFTGADERTSPGSFQIEKTQAETGGAFRVFVKLTYLPVDGVGSWRVAVLLVEEDHRLVVNDVIYLKDKPADMDWRLSQSLSEGCKGPHWVG